MPLIKMQTTQAVAEEKIESVLKTLSDIVADKTGKPAAYIMVAIEQTAIMLAETQGDAALFDIRGIGGLTQPVNEAITEALCTFCKNEFNIPSDRVYATFTDVPRANWGWNNKTF